MSPVQEIAAGWVQSGAIDQLASVLELVDVKSVLSWPSGVEDPQFVCFLDKLGGLFDTLPSSADATIDQDEVRIERDASYVQSFANRTVGLRMLIERRHAETVDTRLNPARTVGFERFPRFRELVEVADRGAIAHFKPGFR
jgi:hypothetical protein